MRWIDRKRYSESECSMLWEGCRIVNRRAIHSVSSKRAAATIGSKFDMKKMTFQSTSRKAWRKSMWCSQDYQGHGTVLGRA